jgi:hypothetical protein
MAQRTHFDLWHGLFFSLQIDLRNIIYSIILISFRTIKIRSLPAKHLWDHEGHRRLRYRRRFGQLLLVNKQWEEASFISYSKNTSAIGTGLYGSTRIPSLHGLKYFFATCPMESYRLYWQANSNLCPRIVIQNPLIEFFTNLKQQTWYAWYAVNFTVHSETLPLCPWGRYWVYERGEYRWLLHSIATYRF